MECNLESVRTKRAKSKGFTLIELMIVVAIIGIVAAIVAINYAHSKSNAQVSASEANLKQIATALELYYSDNQGYPASGTVNSSLLGAKYLPTTPNSPGKAGNSYTYTLDATTGTDYGLKDTATYDSASLATLPKGTDPATLPITAPTGNCGTSGCTHVGYTNTNGLFGY